MRYNPEHIVPRHLSEFKKKSHQMKRKQHREKCIKMRKKQSEMFDFVLGRTPNCSVHHTRLSHV